MIKLICVIENIADEYGGPAVSLPNLLYYLKSEFGIGSVIYSVSLSEGESNYLVDKYNLKWVRSPISGFRKIKFSRVLKTKLESEMRLGRFIFVNNLWNYPSLVSYLLSKRYDIPLITSVRGALFEWSLCQGKWRKKLALSLFQRKALNCSSFIHVTSQDELIAVRRLGITAPVALISHGINSDEFMSLPSLSESKNRLGIVESGKRYFLFMSRLHKKKGLDLLLEVWRRMHSHYPNWELLIAGPDYGNYENHIASMSGVKYLGMLKGEEKLAAFQLASFFVLPSYTENFGVVVGEALASGVPVITTTGTPWTTLAENNCGSTINLSVDELHEVLAKFLSKPEDELFSMGERGKEMIREHFSWSAQAEKFSLALKAVEDGSLEKLEFVDIIS